ncbi:MAG: SDR family NAD(P)-dependent oxidoreductase, partial [Alphaproteobacteria bacterium]
VNNAAIGIGGPFVEQDADHLMRLVALNIGALTALTRHFLPGMLKRQRGGVLNVASIGGLLPGPYQAAYYASKAYVMSLTEALAHEYAGLGVRIAAAAPGPVHTEFHKRMGVNAAHYLEMSGGMSAERAARLIYAGYICRRRVIVPGFFASLAAFAVRYIPHVVLVPFIGWLIKRRY